MQYYDRPHNARLTKIVGALDKFIYGMQFPFFIALVTVLCYATKTTFLGVAIFSALASYVLIFKSDCTPLLSLLLLIKFLFTDQDLFLRPAFFIIISPIAIALIFHFIRFPFTRFNLGRLFLPICVVSIALFTGGLLSKYVDSYANGLSHIIPLGPVILITYLFFANALQYPKGFDIRKYFMVILLLVGLVVAVEFWIGYYDHSIIQNRPGRQDDTGWGNINSLAVVAMFSLPATCYLIVKTRYMLANVLCVFILVFTIYKTESDGCLGITLFYLPFMALFVFMHLKGKKKRAFGWLVGLFILVSLIALLVACITGDINDIVGFLKDSADGDSGRTDLYKNALQVFKECPIFGAGLGYFNDLHYGMNNSSAGRFYFHSTFFHILGDMGIVGLLAYAYYYVERYRILVKHNTPFNVYAFFSFTAFACYGMIDVVEFDTIPSMITMTILLLITEFANRKGADPHEFPLYRD